MLTVQSINIARGLQPMLPFPLQHTVSVDGPLDGLLNRARIACVP